MSTPTTEPVQACSCGHPKHWRECRGTVTGIISGQPIACECRRRGPNPPTTTDDLKALIAEALSTAGVDATDTCTMDDHHGKPFAVAILATPAGQRLAERWENDVEYAMPAQYEALLLREAEAQRDAARADAERLAEHLRRAIHDLVEDWEPDGPQMRYVEARAALALHDEQEPTR